ncbi:MAG: DUF2460 domain-containing protein [Erythrobacter sp.]|nr:MAG: DUF2460 domain-containing protein [Erythrobacter sp.]
MAYWLATAREGQDSDFIQRFDPRFWTVDFPRPMMASVVSTGPDALRVECEFHHLDALAGLIWDSEDRFDHPLTAYATNLDYTNTSLAFRWRSEGVLPLDAVHGPTLTIEGRDAAGTARVWYVRLWNYAAGTSTDAAISIDFSDLREGWLADGAPVHPADIDRMFISLAPTGYDPASTALLPARVNGWVELSAIAADGQHAMLVIGEALVPPHGIGMATAYDDSYNLTPARMLRNVLHLGYRGRLIHYVGMSHFFRLVPRAGDALVVDAGGALCQPCESWHAAFLAECARLGFEPIVSLSYELFEAHCPDAWKQRTFDGTPARTGWVPPSNLLSPASLPARAWLQSVAAKFVALVQAAGLPVLFQIGEPWWWIVPGTFEPCIYDPSARTAFLAYVSVAPRIDDMRLPMGPARAALLDAAGAILAESTAALAASVRAAAGGQAEVLLLVFTPTVLDPSMPELRRVNMPEQWAWPAYDRLQLEDYDWLTGGAEALRRSAYVQVQARLGYPLEQQDYLSGFVLDAVDAEVYWARIDGGIEEAGRRGITQRYVWALPQVARDGYVRLPQEETQVQAFDDVLYPLALGRDAGVSPEFSTAISLTASGHERRNSQWSDARLHYDVGPGIRSHAELGVLLEFFRARRGPARGFRLADPYDFSSNGLTGTPTATDQLIGVSDGLAATFRLRKNYGSTSDPQVRFITRPRAETILVSVNDTPRTDWVLEAGGRIVFNAVIPAGAQVRAGFLFDVPVRFAEDRLDITGNTFAAGEAASVPLIEVREEV